MEKLLPCPFCGWEDGAHQKGCYMLLLSHNIDAIIEGVVPPVSVETLDKAWNTRTSHVQDTRCELCLHNYGDYCLHPEHEREYVGWCYGCEHFENRFGKVVAE